MAITRPLRERLKQLYVDDGKSASAISEILQCSHNTVLRWLRDYDIPIRRKTVYICRDDLERLYTNERMCMKEIADLNGCSIYPIQKLLKKYDIPRRTLSEAKKGLNAGEKHHFYIDPPKEEELTRLYIIEKKDLRSIGKIFNCSPSTVMRWFGLYGIPTRNGSESKKGINTGKDHPGYIEPPPKKELVQLYTNELKTIRDIGEFFGHCDYMVLKWLKSYNIRLRTSAERSALLSGENSPTWKGGNIVKICEQCGNEYETKQSLKDVSRFCTNGCKNKWQSENTRGENCPAWKGGISFEPYCPKFNDAFKESIREKFGRVCFLCPTTEEENGEKLSVHHVNYNKDCLCGELECEFVPLCRPCHSKTGSNRHYWEKLILDRLTKLDKNTAETVIY